MGSNDTSDKTKGAIQVLVRDEAGSRGTISDASITLFSGAGQRATLLETRQTNEAGSVTFGDLPEGEYSLAYEQEPDAKAIQAITLTAGDFEVVELLVPLGFELRLEFVDARQQASPLRPRVGDVVKGNVISTSASTGGFTLDQKRVQIPFGTQATTNPGEFSARLTFAGPVSFKARVELLARTARAKGSAFVTVESNITVDEQTVQPIGGQLGVSLQRTATTFTEDIGLWQAIVNSTDALSFNNYLRFMNAFFCKDSSEFGAERKHFETIKSLRTLPFNDTDAYRVVKAATEAFVMVNCGVSSAFPDSLSAAQLDQLARRDLPGPGPGFQSFGEDYLVEALGAGRNAPRVLPYLAVIRAKLPDIGLKLSPLDAAPGAVSECFGILQDKLTNPLFLELLWSYWHEEGMLVQTIHAITRRFQNVRGLTANDPLANLEIDPLRPLNNLLWGYMQDEQHRLSVVRRNYEYDHHYGLRLEGKAITELRAADTRSKFIEAFHNLLRLCAVLFRQDDDTTVKADAFPVLNSLKEVHLILSQGAHNQFGDLPSTARIEMLIQAFLLARPEFREFLPTRIMVAYPEPWMDRVDAMKKLQGWTDTSALHFRNLGAFGEQILLSARYGHWSDVNDAVQALNWARFFRPQIQGYVHAYRAATGVDLSADLADASVDATLPSVLLKRRLQNQSRSA